MIINKVIVRFNEAKNQNEVLFKSEKNSRKWEKEQW